MMIKKLAFFIAPASLNAVTKGPCLMELVRGAKVEELPDPTQKDKKVSFVVGRDIYNPAAIYRNYSSEYGMRMMEAVRKHFAREQNVNSVMVLGSGSGVDTAISARIFPSARIVASDYAPQAVAATKATAELNKISDRVTVLRSDVFDEIPEQEFDVILFNAPRDLSREKHDSKLDRASTFDKTGEVARKFFEALPERLSGEGSAFVMTEGVLRYPLDESLEAEIVSGPFSWSNPWLSHPLPHETTSFAIWRIYRKVIEE